MHAQAKDSRYQAACLRLRGYAAAEHLRAGQLFREDFKLEETLEEFQYAAEIDRTALVAGERTASLIRKKAQSAAVATPARPQSPLSKMAEEAECPVDLNPTKDSRVRNSIDCVESMTRSKDRLVQA